MTDEQIIEHCLESVAEYDPPCKVPEGIWGFTDRTLRSLLRLAIESKGEQMQGDRALAAYTRRCHHCHVLLADGEMCMCRM